MTFVSGTFPAMRRRFELEDLVLLLLMAITALILYYVYSV